MSEQEPTALAVITDTLSLVPEPIQNTFIKSLSRLLGGAMSIPAAKFKQIAQGIEDTTTARSNLTASLTKLVAESAGQDQLVLHAAAEVLLPDAVRKITNRYAVARKAAERVADEDLSSNNSQSASQPDEDWMNNFMRRAEDASSERLQDMFGRILAGEILHPGAFGLATLRAVSELDQEIANDFVYAWSKNAGGGMDYTNEWQRGQGYSRWRRLVEAGLIADQETTRFLGEFDPIMGELAMWSPMRHEKFFIAVFHEKGYKANWNYLQYTRVGREIGRLLDTPNYRENMTLAALRLPKELVKEIRFYTVGAPEEIIWPAPTNSNPN